MNVALEKFSLEYAIILTLLVAILVEGLIFFLKKLGTKHSEYFPGFYDNSQQLLTVYGFVAVCFLAFSEVFVLGDSTGKSIIVADLILLTTPILYLFVIALVIFYAAPLCRKLETIQKANINTVMVKEEDYLYALGKSKFNDKSRKTLKSLERVLLMLYSRYLREWILLYILNFNLVSSFDISASCFREILKLGMIATFDMFTAISWKWHILYILAIGFCTFFRILLQSTLPEDNNPYFFVLVGIIATSIAFVMACLLWTFVATRRTLIKLISMVRERNVSGNASNKSLNLLSKKVPRENNISSSSSSLSPPRHYSKWLLGNYNTRHFNNDYLPFRDSLEMIILLIQGVVYFNASIFVGICALLFQVNDKVLVASLLISSIISIFVECLLLPITIQRFCLSLSLLYIFLNEGNNQFTEGNLKSQSVRQEIIDELIFLCRSKKRIRFYEFSETQNLFSKTKNLEIFTERIRKTRNYDSMKEVLSQVYEKSKGE